MRKKTTRQYTRRLEKKRLSVWFDGEMMVKLRAEAAERGVSLQLIITSAVAERYSPETQDDRDAVIARRLNRLDNRSRVLERQSEIQAESFALFVRMWLASTPEVTDDQRDAAYVRGQNRYDRYLNSLAKRLKIGQSIFTDLPKEVVLKVEDF